jgi:hypothetical protein
VLHRHLGDQIIGRLVRPAAPVPYRLRSQVAKRADRHALADAIQVRTR